MRPGDEGRGAHQGYLKADLGEGAGRLHMGRHMRQA